MATFEQLIDRNKQFAESGDRGPMAGPPASRTFVLTCVDPRVEPASVLGIDLGEAFVFRTPGGRTTEAAMQDIGLVSYIGEFQGNSGPPIEVAIVHHTKCGMGILNDERFRDGFSARSGIDDAELHSRAVADPHATVQHDVQRLLSSPLATSRIVVSGHVLDLDTGLVTTVVPATAPHTADPS